MTTIKTKERRSSKQLALVRAQAREAVDSGKMKAREAMKHFNLQPSTFYPRKKRVVEEKKGKVFKTRSAMSESKEVQRAKDIETVVTAIFKNLKLS